VNGALRIFPSQDSFAQLAPKDHFAFEVETALGGALRAENVCVMDAGKHMKAVANVAAQIADAPLGTSFTVK
jgi:hypothetical protein